MEKLGYILIGLFYLLGSYLTLKEIEQFYPEGLLVILIYSGLLVLFVKVLKERLNNKDDDYYSKEIDE
ncbi:MAG: hypothetical protein ACJ0Q5_02055 [Candidatus Neomarinimicrobiota bacterium]|nr:hypothetical protein [Candidatus Neomarinimicrobiota bacterium]|tara:strand:+ start:329 stop:532 length:204 start_codon:yes stop_codon:yes gene_type:complete